MGERRDRGKETLPSVVYYKYDMKKNCYNPIIGDFAKISLVKNMVAL